MARKPRKRGSRRCPIGPSDRLPGQKRRGPLVALDTEAIRNAAFRQIQKQRKALEKETQALDHFIHAEQPSFFSWLAGIAGDLMTQGRELEIELERLENLVSGVHERAWTNLMPAEQAYREIRAEEARREAGEPSDLEELEDDDPRLRAEFEAQIKEAFKDFVHANVPPDLRGSFQEEVKRFGKEAFGEDLSWLVGGAGPPHDAASSEAQLKTLYRQLVAILHPDRRHPQLNQAICSELWHELQRAYHDHDLDHLRTVYARVEYSLGIDTPRQTTVWELRNEVANLHAALRAVRNEIKQVRQHPGWKFSSRTGLDSYAVQLKQRLKQDIDFYKKRISELRALLKSWETRRAPKPPKRKRKETWPPTLDLF